MSKNLFQVVALGKKSHGRKSHLIWKRKIINSQRPLSRNIRLVPRRVLAKTRTRCFPLGLDPPNPRHLDFHCCFRQLKGKWFLTVLFLILPPPTCACWKAGDSGRFVTQISEVYPVYPPWKRKQRTRVSRRVLGGRLAFHPLLVFSLQDWSLKLEGLIRKWGIGLELETN